MIVFLARCTVVSFWEVSAGTVWVDASVLILVQAIWRDFPLVYVTENRRPSKINVPDEEEATDCSVKLAFLKKSIPRRRSPGKSRLAIVVQ